MTLADRVALVTGGARGIGAAVAACLHEDGARVAVADLDGEGAKECAEQLGERALGIEGDAADAADAVRFVAGAVSHFGSLDILVNNAGASRGDPMMAEPTERRGTPLETLSQDEWDEQLGQNLRSTFVTTQAALPHLKRAGSSSIVNIASIAGLRADPAVPAYSAAKAGVIQLTKSMALEFATHQIRVNAICPGLVWTRSFAAMAAGMKRTEPEFEELEPREIYLSIVRRLTPLERELMPEDIGRLAAFLCSDQAINITGQAVSIDGGITLR